MDSLQQHLKVIVCKIGKYQYTRTVPRKDFIISSQQITKLYSIPPLSKRWKDLKNKTSIQSNSPMCHYGRDL